MPTRGDRRANGSGSVFETRSGVWAIRWRHDGLRPCRVGYPSREGAESALQAILLELRNREIPDSYERSPNLGTAFQAWIDARRVTHRTWRDDLFRWRAHIAKRFGSSDEYAAIADREAHTLAPGDIEAFVDAKLRSGVSPATVGHCLRLLSRLYSDLVRSAPESGVFANPLRTLDPSVRRRCTPPPHAKRIPFIESPADVDRVMNALAEPYATMFAVGVHAGLRPGEVKALAWPDIDLGRRSIAVSRQVVRGALGPVMRGARRVVPIFDALAPILASWRTGSSGGGFAFRSVALTRGGRRKTDVPLVSNDHTLLLHLDRALQKLAMKRLTWHEATRHTFACHFVRKGGSLERLAAILGHSRAWTVKRYAELAPDAPVEVKANSPAPVGAWSERDAVGGEVALSDMREEERERIAML